MVRGIIGVVAGYIVMGAIATGTMYGLYTALGSDWVFESGSYVPSIRWIIAAGILGFISALIGGILCKAIARSTTPAIVLALLVCIMAVAMSFVVMNRDIDDEAVRTGEVAYFDSMDHSNPPAWSMFINAPIGLIGVLIGASLVGRGKPAQ